MKPLNLKMTKAEPTFDFGCASGNALLICPNCGGESLHAGAPITDFDDGHCAPPDFRGGGIVIPFGCETCTASLYLDVGQHKGATLIGWRVAAGPGNS